MKFLTILFLLLAAPMFGAVPSYTAFRGTGGIIIVSNPPTGTIVIDGSTIAGPTNGVSASMATNIAEYYSTNTTGRPANPNFSVQYNSNGVMQGSSDLLWTNGSLLVNGTGLFEGGATFNGGADFNDEAVFNKSISIVATTNSSTGVIFQHGGMHFIHTYQAPGGSGNNLFIGRNSGNFTLTSPVLDSGSANTGVGDGTLSMLTTGVWNTAVGYLALAAVTGGGQNSAFGVSALRDLTIGRYNTALGDGNSWKVTTGHGNNSQGYHALDKLTIGSYNVALGQETMYSSVDGTNNVAIGNYAIYSGTTGNENTDIGYQARFFNTHGNGNTTIGAYTMWNANAPTQGVAIGFSAGRYATNSYEVYIDNRDRTSSALEKANALFWGKTDAAGAANQTASINAALTVATMSGSGDHVAVNAAGLLMRTNITGGGSGTPGGSTFSVQYNGTNTFAGDTNFIYRPEYNTGDLVPASLSLTHFDGVSTHYTNQMSGLGFGSFSATPLYLLTGSTPRWHLSAAGHFLATADNTYDIGASGATRPRHGYFGGSVVADATVKAPTFNTTAGSGLGVSFAGTAGEDGVASLIGFSGTDFNRLQFGGTTAAFPAIGRSAGDLMVFGANGAASGSTNKLVVQGMIKAFSGTLYPTNIAANLPSAATLGHGGYWVGNSNGTLVALYSTDGTTTAMKVLAP